MPAAAVLARRASRKVKPMRDEPGSDWNADESEEWEDDDEVRVRTPSVAACGFMVSASHQTAWRSTTTAARVWARRVAARQAVVVRGVEPSGTADFEPSRQCLGARSM